MVLLPGAFKKLATQVFPHSTASRLARARGVDPRVAQRWIAGEMVVPAEVEHWIRGLAALQDDAGEPQQGALQGVIQNLVVAGHHRETIAAWLAIEYERLVSRGIQ